MSDCNDDDFVKDFRRLVEDNARRLQRQMGLTCDLEDLVAFGFAGLLEARQRFDHSLGVPFAMFASKRIRGAIIDGVRRMAYVPRRAYARLKAAEALDAVTDPEQPASPTGRPPLPSSEARALAAAHHLSTVLGQMATAYALAARREADEIPEADPDPEELATRKQRTARLDAALDTLSEREQFLIRGHYLEGRALEELAQEVGFSRSWASRLHLKALAHLRNELRKHGCS